MFKILTIFFIISSIAILIAAISNAYRVKQTISSIKNKKIYHFILLNIGITIFFVLYYLMFLAIAFYEKFDTGSLLASFLFFINTIFIFISSLVTKDIGILLFRLDTVRKQDSLTNIYNRHYIEKAIKKEFDRCMRYNRNACLLMIDINNFKIVNDKYGHQAGDKVILDLVKTIQSAARKVDILGRYGGDEFIVLMPETTIQEAKALSTRLCQIISTKVIHTHGHKISYNISIGISEIRSDYLDHEDWMQIADVDLYNDKRLKAS